MYIIYNKTSMLLLMIFW